MTYAEVRENPALAQHAIEYVEQNYPVSAARFKELCGDRILYGFFCVKQKDYGPENIRGGHDLTREYGRMMSIREVGRRTGDKVSRIANITMKSIEKAALLRFKEKIRDEQERFDLDTTPCLKMNQLLDYEIENCDPANESLEDSLVDTAIYGVIAILVYEGLWGR